MQQILCIQPDTQGSDLSTSQPQPIFFKSDRMYGHKTIRFNYTTYDVRRAQDVINPRTSHCNIMLLSSKQDVPSTIVPGELSANLLDLQAHPYIYARVLGIYHANVIYSGPGMISYTPRRMEFLWVRWYTHQEGLPSHLDQLSFPPITSEEAFGFVDPADVVRGCHIIPQFIKGKRNPGGTGFSRLACDSNDWLSYYVGR